MLTLAQHPTCLTKNPTHSRQSGDPVIFTHFVESCGTQKRDTVRSN